MDFIATLKTFTANINETGIPLGPQPPKMVTCKGKGKYATKHLDKNSRSLYLCYTGQVNIPLFIVLAAKQVNFLYTKNEVPAGYIDQELLAICYRALDGKYCITSIIYIY